MQAWNVALTEQRAKEHIQARLDAKTLAGVTAGVWLEGENRLTLCMGQRDPAAGLPMQTDTLFRLASMTKPITGTAVMQQCQRGALELDASIARWLPRFAEMKVAVATPEGEILATRPAARPITPRMLLTHSSGLGSGPAGDAQFAAVGPANHATLAQAVDAYADCALDFQPGTAQMYSGILGMDVLARLVELTADMPYDEYLRKNIFEPLEMADTTYCPTPQQAARLMRLVDARDGALHPVEIADGCGFGDFPIGYTGGGAGLFSTLEDYSHLALMLADGGLYKGRRVLEAATVEAMATPQLPESFGGISRTFNWGLSMRVCPEQAPADAPWPGQPLSAGSFGWSGAYGTHFWVDRKRRLTAVYLSNLADGGGAGAPTAFEFEHDVMAGFGEPV